MVVIILPKFVTELEEKLDEIIKDTAAKYHIDLAAVDDSKSIESGKELISNTLVRIYWNYDVEGRKRLEEFEREMGKFKEKKILRKKVRRQKYPEEMESFIRSNIDKSTNKELVELIKDRFGIKTTVPRISNYMTLKGIRRKKVRLK